MRGLSAARGHGLGRKATWVGPGHVLVPEGSVVWINMFGELWRASIEQAREATTMEKLGVEMVAEGFQEMQERLKRSSHKAGYRDVTQDTEELEDMPADEEGQRRGQPECVLLYKTMSQLIVARCLRKTFQLCQKRSLRSQRMRSCKHGTINDVLLGRLFQSQMPKVQCVSPTWRMSSQFLTIHAEEETMQSMASSVQENENLDGVPESYEAAKPHHTLQSSFLQTGEAEDVEELTADDPTKDYWVYDDCRGILQRHHVHWRKALFSPAQTEGCPIPLRAIRAGRTTKRVEACGSTPRSRG